MAHTAKSVLYYSLLAALVMLPSDSFSAIKISNKSRSYADAYNQVNEVRASVAAPALHSAHTDDLGVVGQTENSNDPIKLPVRVANKALATDIVSGDATDVTYGELEKCAAIYPNGEFAWTTPTAGSYSGGADTCTAVVEMRGYQMGPDGSDLVLARVNVAAGDAVRCNISDWPEYSYLPAAGTITFPYDSEPTVEDVIDQMNQEQKQHAGLKIAAGTLIAAVAGNAIGPNEAGSSAVLGTNKEKLTSTAIGGLTGAAIMAGNVYAGKVAGDMILSAGINAAAGGLIGNMSGIGESVLRTENCERNKDTGDIVCELWGNLIKNVKKDNDKDYFYQVNTGAKYECKKQGNSYTDCTTASQTLKDIVVQGYCRINGTQITDFNEDCTVTESYDLADEKNEQTPFSETSQFYKFKTTTEGDNTTELMEGSSNDEGRLIKIVKAMIVGDMIPVVYEGYKGGFKKADWTNFSEFDAKNVRKRTGTGKYVELTGDDKRNILGDVNGKIEKQHFDPLTQDSDDGALIDFNNKARTKSTIVGAGAGGALGAFTAYQGAQSEIQERWVAAVREYKDSLQKVYCATGNRFLSYYNDALIIPNMAE